MLPGGSGSLLYVLSCVPQTASTPAPRSLRLEAFSSFCGGAGLHQPTLPKASKIPASAHNTEQH